MGGRKPPHQELARTARWLLHQVQWGTLVTNSVELDGAPFGNAASCADGPVGKEVAVTGHEIWMRCIELDVRRPLLFAVMPTRDHRE